MKRSLWIVLLVIATLISSCGPEVSISATATPLPIIETPVSITPQATRAPTETPSVFGQYMIPPYYSDAYIAIINGSKAEENLTIYSNLSDRNWDPLITTFNSHYPWIKVTAINTGAAGAFIRYDNEALENLPTADMIISIDPVGWSKFLEARKELIYASEENSYLPDMAKSVYKTYAISAEPLVIIYNKKSVPVPPQNMVDLAALVKSDLNGYQGQIVTADAEHSVTAFGVNWFWIDQEGTTGWDILNAIGESNPILMESDSKVVEAVGKGEAKIGYFVSTSAILPYVEVYPDIGWGYMSDDQPVLLNSMAITERAASPNSAKLMTDFILSQEGQYALALGGLTPFRSDVSSITEYNLDRIFTQVGNNNVNLYSFDTRLNFQSIVDGFLSRWKDAVHQKLEPTPAPTQTN